MRLTRQRKAILEALRTTRSHPTAEEILYRVRTDLPSTSLASVYRNLRVLKEEGLVREIVTGGHRRYDGVLTDHAHFICERCHRVYDLEDEAWRFRIGSWLPEGFSVSGVHLELRGRCPKCG
ncbi:MAG: transcriptional repressor [Armatimonadota bacterium]|nr:transcriptional repressor [Armatimonadota bacterium]MDR7602401.1 transcriptional repressor [Armatimonadota bacterium]